MERVLVSVDDRCSHPCSLRWCNGPTYDKPFRWCLTPTTGSFGRPTPRRLRPAAFPRAGADAEGTRAVTGFAKLVRPPCWLFGAVSASPTSWESSAPRLPGGELHGLVPRTTSSDDYQWFSEANLETRSCYDRPSGRREVMSQTTTATHAATRVGPGSVLR